jgi:hypothetical protein
MSEFAHVRVQWHGQGMRLQARVLVSVDGNAWAELPIRSAAVTTSPIGTALLTVELPLVPLDLERPAALATMEIPT